MTTGIPNNQNFTDFLYTIGFNVHGVSEVLKRIDENRATREDLNTLRRFKDIAPNEADT